jgi:hypothetical protein
MRGIIMRRNILNQDLSKIVRKTGRRADQMHGRIKDFVETSDEMANQICTTVKKVLSTTEEVADVVHEAIQRVTRGDNSLRYRIESLLDTDDLSEESLGNEIRKFLDTATARGTQDSGWQGKVKDYAEKVEKAAESASEDVIPKLRELVDSADLSVEELRHKIGELIEASTPRESRSEEHTSDEHTSGSQGDRQNERMAKALDRHFGANGKLIQKYKTLDRFNAPVSGALLLALISALEKKDFEHDRGTAATEFESEAPQTYAS